MTLFERMRRAMGLKESAARVLVSEVQGGRYIGTEARFEKLADEGYNKNVVAFRACGMLAQSIAQLDWCLYRKAKSSTGKPVEILDHPMLTLIARPNPMQGKTKFFESVTAFELLAGNSYIEAVAPSPSKPPLELWPIRPDRMTVKPGVGGMVGSYKYEFGGKSKEWTVDAVKGNSPILHLRTFNPTNDWYGLSKIQVAAMAVDQHNDASKWNAALLQNAARPSGFLVATVSAGNPSGTLSEEQFKRTKEQIEERFSGARNAGRPMVLEGGLDWKQISLTPAEMDWINGKNVSAREVALVFGVPGMMLNIPGDNKYANYKEARLAFYQETVLPQADAIRDELNHWLVPQFGEGFYLDYDRDEIDALAPVRDERWDRINSATFLKQNEKREAVGYSPVDGGDVILVSSTMVPLEQAGAMPDPAVVDPAADPAAPPVDQVVEDPEDGKAFKFVALRGPKDRAKEWTRQQKLRTPHERRLKRNLGALFSMEGVELVKAVEGLDPQLAEQEAVRVIEGNRKHFQMALTQAHRQCGEAFGARTLGMVKSLEGAYEIKDGEETRFADLFGAWINKFMGSRVTDIENASKDRVVQAIRKAAADTQAEGEGAVPFADRIQEKLSAIYDEFETYRADRIARTETVTASNVAQKTAAQASGIQGLQKEWLSAHDDRVRADHEEADGEQVSMDGKFKVGGVELDHPGDPDGPANEVINCRCTLAIIPPDVSEDNE